MEKNSQLSIPKDVECHRAMVGGISSGIWFSTHIQDGKDEDIHKAHGNETTSPVCQEANGLPLNMAMLNNLILTVIVKHRYKNFKLLYIGNVKHGNVAHGLLYIAMLTFQRVASRLPSKLKACGS